MKMSEKELSEYTRAYNPNTEQLYRQGSCWAIYEAPNSILGPVYITSSLFNNPYYRETVGRDLGVEINFIKDVAHTLRLEDGTQCKPNWFDENFIVLSDREHKVAIALTSSISEGLNYYRQWDVRHTRCVYPSPVARPNAFYPIHTFMPDIKAGNKAVKDISAFVGEARLRAGILDIGVWGIGSRHWDGALEELCKQFKAGIKPDLTDKRTIGLLINPQLNTILRREYRRACVSKELVYEP